jgi:hypothetical protein
VIGARLRGTLICGGALAGLFTASASGQQAGGVSERSLLPDSVLLAPQPEPDCAFKTNDPDATERQQLDYERQCYRHAEMIVRNRLQMLQDAIKERPGGPASRATTTATGGGPRADEGLRRRAATRRDWRSPYRARQYCDRAPILHPRRQSGARHRGDEDGRDAGSE